MNTDLVNRKPPRLEMNPVIVKELRSRMRGFRSFAMLTSILALLSLFSYVIYHVLSVSMQYQYTTTPLSTLVGQLMFAGLSMLVLLIVCAITPALTAGAISGEQEKQTYEMLLATPLHPASILWGKLISALSFVLILIFAAIPMASLVFIFGGVTVRDMLKALITIISVAVMLGVVGLFTSALFGRTGRATAVAYLIVVLLIAGPVSAFLVIAIMQQGSPMPSEPPRWILVFSPLSALASSFAPSVNLQNLSGMFWMLGSIPYWITGPVPVSYTSIPRPLYHYSLPLYGTITLVLYLIATRLVRPTRKWRIHWSELLLGLVLILGYTGMVALAFGGTANRYENIILIEEVTPTPAPTMEFNDNKNPSILTPVQTPGSNEAPGNLPYPTPPPPPLIVPAYPEPSATPAGNARPWEWW